MGERFKPPVLKTGDGPSNNPKKIPAKKSLDSTGHAQRGFREIPARRLVYRRGRKVAVVALARRVLFLAFALFERKLS